MTAAVVAGFIGSALHSVLLAEAPRARLLAVERPGIGHENYDAVARARHLRQTYVAADFAPYEQAGPSVTFTLAEPGRLADALCREAARTDPSSARFNAHPPPRSSARPPCAGTAPAG
jgi:hypothetical protein